MRVAIHQPNFLPWLGYFYKMVQADIFVILDNVQYEKNGYTNRCQIKTPQGPHWLTLPVQRNFPQMINEAELANYERENKRILKTICQNYQKAKYFNYLFVELKKILEKDWEYLSALNIELLKFIKDKLEIKTRLEIASDYNLSGKSTDLLINLCQIFNGDVYLSGGGGKKYQDEESFKRFGIKLEYLDFIHPTYSQLWGNFILSFSIIDLIFNHGPNSLEILLSGNKKI
jgi:hypothetical protein